MKALEPRRSPKLARTSRLLALAPLLLVGAAAAAACGIDDVSTRTTPSGGGGGEGNSGGTSGSGATGNTSGGGDGNAPQLCNEGDTQCGGMDGNTPQTCDSHGAWQDSPDGPCAGSTPVCNARGSCSAYRLANAGIASLSPRTDPVTLKGGQMIVLKEQALSAGPRTCGMVKGKQLCVTGGIR